LAVYRRTNRARTLLVVLVLVAITLITIDGRSNGSGSGILERVRGDVHDALSPVQRATHAALQPIGNFLSGAADYGSLRAQNDRLRREIAANQAGAVSAAAEQQEAERIIAAAHLPFLGGIPNLQAEVIDVGPSNFQNTVTIDKGTDDGLALGQPVVAAGADGGTGGLVGDIGSVSGHTATVNLLTDPSFVVGVALDRYNIGSAEGVGAGSPMRVTVDTPGAPLPAVRKGDPIGTSGLPLEAYPPGIPVGTVESVVKSGATLEPAITLQPLVDLSQLDIVTVELWSPQTGP
jgi:rod shape-determining protein MreC